MKLKRIARLFAIVLTLVTMVSCLAVVLTVNTSAVSTNATSNCLIISGTDLANANERNQVTTVSTTGGVWKFRTTGNDPYVNTAAISGVGDTVLRTYPYVVVRYRCSTFTSMEIFCGHPNTAARRVSMPAPETNGQWGCLFYDFSPFPNEYKSWFRLEMATASGIEMEIAEVVLFKNTTDVTAYHNVYAKAGGGGCEVLTFNDMGFHGNGVTGRTGNSGDVSSIAEVRPDSNTAMFNEGGYFTRLTSGGNDGYLEFRQNGGAATNGVKNFSKVAVRYRTTSGYNGRTMQLFFAVDGAYSEGNSSKATIVGDGHWQWAFFTNPLKGSANSLRFDYMTGTGHVDVAEIYFYNSTADVYSASVGAASRRNVANATWFHSGMYFLHKNNNTYFTSVGTISGGTLNGKQRSATGATFDYGTTKAIAAGRTFYIREGTHSAHDSNTTVSTTAATCLAAPTKTTRCSLCAENQQTTTTGSALAHNQGRSEVTTQPTCAVAGVRTFYCTNGCGKANGTEAVAKLPHTEAVDAAVAATCTKTGLTEGCHCSVCQEVITAQEVIDMLPHTEVTDAAVEPDCTNTGLTQGCHCSVCSTVITAQEVVDALGHNEVIDAAVEPDCTHAGKTEGKHCDRCSEILLPQVPVDALGHNITSTPEVQPTYTTVGHAAGQTCSRCDEVDVVGEEIPKLNPLLSYNVALNEKFAVNMTYVAFDGASITVVDESGTAYAFTATNTGKTHTDGLPIWSIRIADISARDIGHIFTVSESLSGYSSNVSVDGYCGQVDQMYAGKTVESLTADYVAAGMTEEKAQATAIKTLQAYDTTQKITIYGQAAKNYFDQANGDHEGLQTQIDAYTPTGVVQEVSNTGLVKFRGATVVFGDEVELLLKMENYNREKIFVKMGDGEYVEVPESEINSRLSTDGMYVYFSIIVKPDEFSTAISVRAGSWVMGEDGNNYYAGGSTVTYSVDKYIANMQTKYAGQTDAKALATLNMVNALGNYGYSASTYAKN